MMLRMAITLILLHYCDDAADVFAVVVQGFMGCQYCHGCEHTVINATQLSLTPFHTDVLNIYQLGVV